VAQGGFLNEIKTHLGYVVAITVALVAGYIFFTSWRSEHDARLIAQVTLQADESKVKVLQAQVATIQLQAAQTIAALQRQKAQVKTPAQAIEAIPNVSTLPLHTTAIPDQPNQVAVDALSLYQELNQCQQDTVALNACRQQEQISGQIATQKDDEIATLKKKPSFWHRVWGTAKAVGIGIGIGVTLARL
jgi:ribosomal protein L11